VLLRMLALRLELVMLLLLLVLHVLEWIDRIGRVGHHCWLLLLLRRGISSVVLRI